MNLFIKVVFFTLIMFVCWACSSTEPEVRVLVQAHVLRASHTCTLGGLRITSGLDLNSNKILDEGEVTAAKIHCVPFKNGESLPIVSFEIVDKPQNNCLYGYIRTSITYSDQKVIQSAFCYDTNDIIEMMRLYHFPHLVLQEDETSRVSTSVFLDFDISEFLDFDTVRYSILSPDQSDIGCTDVLWTELYDLTNKQPIIGSQIMIRRVNDRGTVIQNLFTQGNFSNNFPSEKIELGIRLSVDEIGCPRVIYKPQLLFYKN